MTSQQSARGVMDRVRDGASSQMATQKDRATDSLTSLAQAVRQSTQSLRDRQQTTIAEYIERAADRIEQFSTTVRERDMTELMHDAERFARRQPAIFIGAAFAAGVLASRFLKSSADGNDYTSQGRSGNRLPASSGATGGTPTGVGGL